MTIQEAIKTITENGKMTITKVKENYKLVSSIDEIVGNEEGQILTEQEVIEYAEWGNKTGWFK